MRRLSFSVLATGVWLASSGCAMMHELQPHRMWRWNRGPAPSTNPFFSVSDPIPQLGEPAESLDLPEETADSAGNDQPAARQ
jgi:hypothetical protein